MIRVPQQFKPLLSNLVATFAKPATARRMIVFSVVAILTVGDRTVSNVLRLLSLIESVNPSTYHRLFSHRRWNSRPLAFAIAKFVIERWVPSGEIRLCGDETVDGHRGKKVYGKARHRDAVRSSHSNTVFRYGHKWIVLAILVDIPYCNRPIALPVLVTLYRDASTNKKEGRRHKTPAELMCGLLALMKQKDRHCLLPILSQPKQKRNKRTGIVSCRFYRGLLPHSVPAPKIPRIPNRATDDACPFCSVTSNELTCLRSRFDKTEVWVVLKPL